MAQYDKIYHMRSLCDDLNVVERYLAVNQLIRQIKGV